MPALQIQLVGLEVLGSASHRAARFAHERRRQRGDDRRDDLILDLEHVRHLAVVAVRPDVVAIAGVRELRSDPKPRSRAPDAALENRRRSEVAADLPDISIPFAEPE